MLPQVSLSGFRPSLGSYKKYGCRLILHGLIAGALFGTSVSARAATLIWDANPSVANPQEGSSSTNWSTSSAVPNWWDGSQNVLWSDSNVAQFGAGGASSAKTVTVSGQVNVGGLIFGSIGTPSGTNPGYTLAGGAIVVADNGRITLADGASASTAFSTISSALGGNNITLDRTGTSAEQFIAFTGANTWGGKLTLAPGAAGLFVRVSGAASLNTLDTVDVGAGNTLSLQGQNATYESDFIVGGVGGGSGAGQRGAMRFDNSMTLTGAITLSSNAVLNFQSSTPTAADVVFTQGIGESGGSFDFTKTGLGTLTLRGASTYTGATTVDGFGAATNPGTLLLDFANSTTTDNLLYHGVEANVLILTGTSSRAVAESTATLAIFGKDGTANSQIFGGVSVTGPTAITVKSGAGGSVNVDLGSITRDTATVGATLSITGPEHGSVITAQGLGLIGPWATYTTFNGVTGWAESGTGGVVGQFSGETDYRSDLGPDAADLSRYASTINLRIAATSVGDVTQTATATLATISMTDPTARVISTGGQRLNTGGVQLVNGAGNLTIGSAVNVGTLSFAADSGTELFLSNFDPTSLLTINSVIANGTVVILNGTGTTIFAGSNTYTGSTIVASGILELRANSALGGSATGTTIAAGATVRLAGGLSVAENFSLGGTGVSGGGALLSLGAQNTVSGTLNLTSDARIVAANGSTLTLSKATDTTTGISGSFNAEFGGGGTIVVTGRIASATVTKTDSGTLVLSGNNTYTGSTTISAGVVRITNAAALGTVAGGTVVNAGAALEISSASPMAVGAELITLSGTGIADGGALRNVAGDNSLAGRITLSGATRINSDAGTLTLDVVSGSAITSTAAQNVTFGGAGNIVVADAITIGSGTVTKDGSGTLTLSGANTYTGATTIQNGTLALGANDVFANTAPLVVNGGTFSIGAFSDTLATVTLQSGTISGTTGVLTAGTYAVQSGTISASLAGASATLTKTTSGTVTLSGANTYGGMTTINAGRLILDYSTGNVVLPATNALTLGGGTLELKGGTTSTAIGLGDINLAVNTGLSTIVVGSNAAVTANDLKRNGATAVLIDLSAAGSSLKLTAAPTVINGQLTGTGGNNAAVVMRDGNGRYDFAAVDAGNSIIRLNAGQKLAQSGGSGSTPYFLAADNSTYALTGDTSASSLRIDTNSAGGTLDLAGHTLTLQLFGLLIDGSKDYTIGNSGSGGSLFGSSAVYVYQFGTGKLTLGASITAPQAFFMGPGLVDWTASTGVGTTYHLYGSTLRISGTALSMGSEGTGNTALLNIGSGGILELASGDFTRALGIARGNVRFVGEGGFSAYGGNHFVNLGGAGAAITWGGTTGISASFLASGSKLILGSKYANATVEFQNALNLNGANQTVEVQSINQAGIGGQISGNITGSGASSLTKTGQGILTLSGTNSYTGSTFVNEGTLAITGSIANNASVKVAGGAELLLSGAGSISAGALALDNAAKLSLEVGTLGANPISITGTTTISGSIALALTLTADPTDGSLFTLIDSNMLAGYTAGGRFYYNGVALNDGDTFTVANGGFSQFFQISYHGGGDGADVTVLAVPEPSPAAVLVASTGLLLGLNRFRRRLS